MNILEKLHHLETFEGKLRTWTRARLAGVGTFALALAMVLALLISEKSPLLPTPHRSVGWNSAALISSTHPVWDSARDTIPVIERDGIPITTVRDEPDGPVGLSMNSEVVLTDPLAKVAQAFNKYLEAHQEFAIVTSGYRSPQTQLDIIKQRIDERDADSRFPKLDDATVADVSIWLRAWHWLVRRHVPVNAPLAVEGANVSMHTKGRAMDFISDNLDHLRSMLADFERSKYAKEAPMHITAIVREPGCVHINLA